MVHDIALALEHITLEFINFFKSMSDIHLELLKRKNSIGKSGEKRISFTTTWWLISEFPKNELSEISSKVSCPSARLPRDYKSPWN